MSLELLQPRFGKPGHGTAVLRTPAERLKIEDVPQAALARLRRALAAEGAPAAEGDSVAGGPLGDTSHHATTDAAGLSDLGPPAVDWTQAEELAVWHLRLLGYPDARCTRGGADSGVDVLATGAVAQVKHWAQPVGQPPLRDLFGVGQAAAAKPFFYSLSGYTPQALEWANATNMALFAYSADGRVLAQNSAAHMLAPSSARPGGGNLGFFEQARADRYRRELEKLRQEINDLTALMHKRTQSRRPAVRRSAGEAASLLLSASRALDGGDVLPPADRRREDFHQVVREALKQVKRLL
ncbi:restriction endonuclease [Micromonospora sp. IBSANI012]|uniref:restriction endonuclease n=1 Tax=Micromonospora sp. IBSANI012 TaxID=3457761 RepID=UPI00405938FB